VVEGIRAEVRRAAPDLPIQSTVTMDEAVAASVAQPRFRMVLLGLFAMTATLIATVRPLRIDGLRGDAAPP
jgi:hypothetical protein